MQDIIITYHHFPGHEKITYSLMVFLAEESFHTTILYFINSLKLAFAFKILIIHIIFNKSLSFKIVFVVYL